MKINSFARCTINLLTLVLLAAVTGPPAPAQSEVRFQLVHDALIIVPVTAANEGPLYFLLDTGADTTIVDTALAKRLSLVPLQSAKQTTVAGSQTVNVSVLASLAVGSAQLESLPVLEEDLSSLRRLDRRIDGIVGQNFLSHFNYLLDYHQRTLRIEQASEILDAIDGDQVPEVRMTIAAKAQLRGDGGLRLQLDSGANGLVLMGRAASALYFPRAQPVVETSATGATVLNTSHIECLTVASQEFHDLPVTLAANAPQGRIEDGLLPTSLFATLYVNNRQGFVMFNPQPKKR